MRYLGPPGFQTHPLMRTTLLLTLLVLLGLWSTNLALFLTRLGFDPAAVAAHYRGSEEDFIPPRTMGSMLEVTHAHLATMAVVVLLVTHLAVFLPWERRTRALWIALSFGALLLGEGASWGIRFVHPAFAWVKIGSFIAFQASTLVLGAALAGMLLRPSNGDPCQDDESPRG